MEPGLCVPSRRPWRGQRLGHLPQHRPHVLSHFLGGQPEKEGHFKEAYKRCFGRVFSCTEKPLAPISVYGVGGGVGGTRVS